jgi:hypothetical protein
MAEKEVVKEDFNREPNGPFALIFFCSLWFVGFFLSFAQGIERKSFFARRRRAKKIGAIARSSPKGLMRPDPYGDI